MRIRKTLPAWVAASTVVLLGAGRLAAEEAAPAPETPPAPARAATPAPELRPPPGISFPFRIGVGVTPVVGYSMVTLGYGEVHSLDNGGWVPIDLAPAIRVWRSLAFELAVSGMIPIKDAWGFPGFRLAVTPAVRIDGSLLYARFGPQFMFGDNMRVGVQAAVGAKVYGPLYVGVQGLASLTDIIFGIGPEIGVRFDDWRIVTSRKP
ncbi:hypothetical protein [Polyangium fumosum]|uniref:Outer membrane protein beta-barrel domain-containing protein n=1 Tax=Polyangium fumosum TaxID=889272 RepID=A0A4U1IWI8_9BACT|nr:hypothetical protein [Polyangium fumosum]TKC98920.1 hypothetical protein E8A74_39690 [Polyangium fumosum]